MPAVLVTGMSGVGKSAALQALAERGYEVVDTVVLLTAPADVLLRRIESRRTNPFGKRAEEREEILRHLREVEPLLRATSTHLLDATLPLEDVVARLAAEARTTR